MNYKLRKFEINGLFGRSGKTIIEINESDQVSFLTGRNGSGKTTILHLIKALADSDWHRFINTPFDLLIASFEDVKGSTFTVRIAAELRGKKLNFGENGTEILSSYLHSNVSDAIQKLFQQGVIHKAKCGRHWADANNGHMTDDQVAAKYGPGIRSKIGPNKLSLVSEKLANWQVHLIEVKRLYEVSQTFRRNNQASAELVSTVDRIPQQLRSQFAKSGNLVTTLSQNKATDDLRSLLEFDKDKVPSVKDLQGRLKKLQATWPKLANVGLFVKTKTLEKRLEIPDTLTIELRHSINQKLTEIERNTVPLVNFLALIDIYHEVISPTMHDLDIEFGATFGIRFKGNTREIKPCNLSSGQQHLLFLMYQLIFNAQQNHLFLIDEPEISMDIEWQRDLAERLERVSKINNNSYLLATHSVAIISERWESCNELA